jgi:hypothetical protein
MYTAAEELYRRVAADGEESLARLVESAKAATSDGQK